jgi:O-antigen biosynthesis protein
MKLSYQNDKSLPVPTKRKLVFWLMVKVISHPKLLFKNFNPANIGRLFYHLKSTNTIVLEKIIDNRLHISSANVSKYISDTIPNPEEISDVDQIKELPFPSNISPSVSIIIPAYNNWRYTYCCLKSILENTEKAGYEIIVANDKSTDETSSMLKMIKGIKVVNNELNLGFLMNCNNATHFSSGKYILFLNNDTYVTKGWLEPLLKTIEREDVGAVGAKLIYPNGTLQEAGGIIRRDGSGWNYGYGDDPEKYEYNYVKEVDYCTGACLLVRRELFEKLGGFDKRYKPAYYEETDLCFSFRNLGYKTMYQPKSTVIHYEKITLGKDRSSQSDRLIKTNRAKFLNKWKGELDQLKRPDRDYFLARDRSWSKKVILIIDNGLPEYDNDAEAFTLYRSWELLTKENFKIIYFPDNLRKTEPYAALLQQIGIEVTYGPFDFNFWMGKYGRYLDIIWLSRPDISTKYQGKLKKKTNAKIVRNIRDLDIATEGEHLPLSTER